MRTGVHAFFVASLIVVGAVAAHDLPPSECEISDWRFQIHSGIVTIEGVLKPGWAGNQIYIQAYSSDDEYLGNVDGFITRGGSFTAMATGFPSASQMKIQYHCG
jgi:hypothetical protein